MKIIKKVKRKITNKVRRSGKYFSIQIALVSMLLNMFSPFLLSYSYVVYAEDIVAPATEEIVSEETSIDETIDGSESEESNSEDESTDTEEVSSQETSSTQETTAEGDHTSDPVVQETVTQETEVQENALNENIETINTEPEIINEPEPAVEEISAEDPISVEEPIEETGTEETVVSEENAIEPSTSEPFVEISTEPVLSEPEGDILPDGISDYRPEPEITPAVTDANDVADSVVEAVEQKTGITEQVCLSEGTEIINSNNDDWNIDSENGYAETKDPVKLGVKYIFPEEKDVTLTFKCLPLNEEDRSILKIQKVKVEDLNLPDEFKTDAEYAYDITTEMEDRSFEYDLTLPKPEGVEAKISYIEKDLNEVISGEVVIEDIEIVEEEKVKQNKDDPKMKAEDLDHFTTFLVTFSKNQPAELLSVTNQITEPITNDFGMCIEDAAEESLNCTANDVSITDATVYTITDPCDFVGDTATFTAIWDVQSTATERYDIGLYFATGGQNTARRGSCSVSTLPNYTVPSWFDYDSDDCGDISSSDLVHPVIELTVVCQDPDKDNLLNVPYCASWDNQAGAVCSGPDDAIPSTKSKCNCPDGGVTVPITVPFKADIEVVKDLVPDTDGGKFNLQIDGITKATDVGDNGTTEKVSVSAGTSTNPGDTHTVGEIAGTGTNLDDYGSTISCVDRDKTTFNGGSPKTQSGTGPLTIPVDRDDDIVCTITNSLRVGSITIIKNTVPNDAQDFTFTATGGLSGFTLDDDSDATISNTKIFTNVLPGAYTITEDAQTGFSLTDLSCVDPTGNSTVDLNNRQATINLGVKEDITCTFTNTKLNPSLNVEKSADVDSVDAKDDVITYTITVENTGNQTLTGVSVDDTMLSNEDCDPITAGYQNTGLTINVGQTLTCTGTYTVTQSDIDAGNDLVNVVTADSEETDSDTATDTVTIDQNPSLNVEKSADVDSVDAKDDVITYTITVENTGNQTLTGVSVDDTMLSNEDCDPITAGYQNTGLTINVGQTLTCTGTYDVTQSDIDAGADFVNVVTADSDQTGSDTATDTVTIDQNPSLDIDKNSTTTEITFVGQIIPYTFEVTNTGNVTLTQIVVTDPNCGDAPEYVSGDVNDDSKLQLTETWNYTCSHTVTQAEIDNNGGGDGDLDNTATADSNESAPAMDDHFIPITASKIIIVKETLPDASTQSFEFDPSWLGTNIFLSDGQQSDSNWMSPGSYSISEIVPAGWDLTDINCVTVSATGGLFSAIQVAAPTAGVVQPRLIDLESRTVVTCTFTNTQRGSINGQKYQDWDGNGAKDDGTIGPVGILGWTIQLFNNIDLINPLSTTTTDASGNYSFVNLIPGTYNICEVPQTGWIGTDPGNNVYCKQVELSAGETEINVDFGNFQEPTITVCKYEDTIGIREQISSVLYTQGWEVNLWGMEPLGQQMQILDTRTTGENGCYTWSGFGLLPNYIYAVSESPKDYWDPNGPTTHEFGNLISGSAYRFDFHNIQVKPELYISKSNDSTSTESVGNLVEYTIKVRVEKNKVKDVNVIDLLPKGFDYQGDGKAYYHDTSADTDTQISPVISGYASPGYWQIGDIEDGDYVKLVYTAKILSEVDAGIYKDLAMAYGNNEDVRATGEDSEYVNDEFVGTTVEIDKEQEPDKGKVDIEVNEEEVLGSSDVRLPATGISPVIVWTILAGSIIGSLLLIIGGVVNIMKKRKEILSIIVAVLIGLFSIGQVQAAGNLVVRLEDPDPAVIDDFNITFVVLDLVGERNINYKCYFDTPADPGNFDVFQDGVIGTDDGDTANCNVDEDVLDDEGTYHFYVKVWANTDEDTSDTVKTSYDGTGPDKPKYIEKDKKTSCKNEITLKTADDGDETVRVEVYRSDEMEFTVKDSNRIKSKDLGSDEKYTFIDEFSGDDCGKKFYYGVRAFDASGNASKVRSEEITETTTVEKEGETTIETEAYIVSGTSVGTGEEGAEGAEVVLESREDEDKGEGEGDEGSVLGTSETEETKGFLQGLQNTLKTKWWLWGLGLLFLIIIANVVRRKKANKQ